MSIPTSSTPLLQEPMVSAPDHTFLWRSGAIFVAIGMLAGAFGTHALKSMPGIATEAAQAFQSACHYAIYNGVGLLAVSMHPRFSKHRFAGPAIIFGGGLFSLSIAALVLLGPGSVQVPCTYHATWGNGNGSRICVSGVV
ncbi:hypothetical protein F5887DRAFT_943161, partial [Amanita rubescens]